MITEIYIENNRLDLSKDLSSEFTYAIDDIQDFAARNTNFSKTIILPGNAINNKLFGHIFEFSSSNFYNSSADNVGYNFNASKSASCVIYVDKIQMFKGILRLLEITLDRGTIEYECVVFGELGGFVTALSNRRIEDLDFSAYNHAWNETNITNSWNQASGTTASGMGYYYPLIDYGQVSYSQNQNHPKKDWSYKAFRPALFVKEYLDKIITNSGYTYEAPFFDTNLFKRLVIPNNQKQLSNYTKLQFDGDIDALIINSVFSSTADASYPNPDVIVGYEFGIGGYDVLYWTSSSISPILTLFINGTLEIPQGGTGSLRVNFFKNGSIVNTQTVIAGNPQGRIDFQRTITHNITLATNDYFSVQFELFNLSGNSTCNIYGDSYLTSTTNTAVSSALAYGSLIFMNSGIPRGIYQRDFIASIIKMFNLYIVEDTTKGKHLKIVPFIDFYTTTANFLQVNDLEEELLVDNLDLLLLDDYSASHLDW
ncbi:MAG: hypothetical protein FJY17_02035, partial [Bacteroidetes bacterium]|nr:hypothetical protein [Bacteroidota bacterium]